MAVTDIKGHVDNVRIARLRLNFQLSTFHFQLSISLRHGFIEMQSIEVALEVVEQIGLCRAAEKLHTARVVQTICENSLQRC